MDTSIFNTPENQTISNEIYEKFYHTINYLTQKSEEFDRNASDEDFAALMQKCGYSKKQKFILHRKQWNVLERKVPKDYLDGIGVKIHTIHFTLELDQEGYDRILDLPYTPTFATVLIMPGIYQTLTLPDEISEQEAIEIMQIYAKDHNISCYINLPDIKTILFNPDGEVDIRYYPPVLEEDKKWISPIQYSKVY